MQWTGVQMDREWPVVGKTSVSECEQDISKTSWSCLCVSFRLTLWPCVWFPDGDDSCTRASLFRPLSGSLVAGVLWSILNPPAIELCLSTQALCQGTVAHTPLQVWNPCGNINNVTRKCVQGDWQCKMWDFISLTLKIYVSISVWTFMNTCVFCTCKEVHLKYKALF